MRWLVAAFAALLVAQSALAATQMVPSPVTIVPLDVATVTTGGTAVVAIASGNRPAGAWIANPSTATTPLCISEVGTASTTSAGSTTCIAAGTSYVVTPGNGAVSVNATDSAHAFSGQAMK